MTPLKAYIVSTAVVNLIAFVCGLFIFSKWMDTYSATPSTGDPSCVVYDSVICANGGLLVETENGFRCKCTPNYYGDNCMQVTFWANIQRLTDRLGLGSWDECKETIKTWWKYARLISHFKTLRVYEFHQNQVKKLKMFPDQCDHCGSGVPGARILPPARPSRCLPDKRLPSLELLSDELFRSKPNEFKSDPNGRNMLYHAFYQYFMLQFFGSDFQLNVTASQLYGTDERTEFESRTFTEGKLKTDDFDSEIGSSFMSFVKRVVTFYRSNDDKDDDDVEKSRSRWFNGITSRAHSSNPEFPLGRRWPGTSAVRSAMFALWVSEHNRVCDLLLRERPLWTDGQVYDTARRIVTGEMMTIMMNDIMDARVAHSYPTKLEPDTFRFVDRHENVGNSDTPIELFLTTMWPTDLRRDEQVSANDNSLSSDHVVESMVKHRMGMITHNNENMMTKPLVEFLMRLSRDNSLQSFNNYRRHLGLQAYGSFFELTGNLEMAEKLRNLYKKIENVELLSGILTEKAINGISPTLAAITNSFVINSILTNPLTSSWTPDTFGGDEGFEIVRSANIESFVCNNLPGKCDGFKVKLYAEN